MQSKILTWYKKHGRHDLPWRQRPTPYRVLVSEIMLQQTQVTRVIQMYNTFLREFTSMRRLAAASKTKLLSAWSGLGYNRRALYLQQTAKIITVTAAGRLPDKFKELIALPGIGTYTAHAINIFARNLDEVCIDTNVRRVLTAELNLPLALTDAELERVAYKILPLGKSRDWHNALMDYGATVHTARNTGIAPRVKQTAFLGSARYYRGKIVRLLLDKKKMTVRQLSDELGLPLEKTKPLIEKMVQDSLITFSKKFVRIAS